jgi:hypothetical protein
MTVKVYEKTHKPHSDIPTAPLHHLVSVLILIRFQDETNSGRVAAWQDHAGLIQSSFSGRK